MTGYLGYDPEMVNMLRVAMALARDDLTAVRCSDVEAAAAMRSVARSLTTLNDTWLPFTAGLFACRAMDGYVPTTLRSGDLIDGWLRLVAEQRHWRVTTDPAATVASASSSRMSIEEARAIGQLLSGSAGSEPMTPLEVDWLSGRLARIAAQPSLVAAFLHALTTTGWTAVCNQLGTNRQDRYTDALLYDGNVSSPEAHGWKSIDGVFVSLGAMLVIDRSTNASKPELLLPDIDPYAAAMLVQNLRFDAEQLSKIASKLIERERRDLRETPVTRLGPRAADLLFETMLITPGGATAYVLATIDDPSLLLDVAFDPSSGNRVLVAGTDPLSMSAADAAAAIPGLVRWILNASTFHASLVYNAQLPTVAADLLSPYILPVLRSTSDSFAMSADERRALETLVLSDERAFERLVDARDRATTDLAVRITASDTSVEDRLAALRDFASLVAIVDTMSRDRTIRRAEADVAQWDLLWSALGYGASAGSIASGSPAASAPGMALTALRIYADAHGWGPVPVDSVRSESLATLDRMTTVAAAALVASAFDQMVTAGRIPAKTPPPPLPDFGANDVGADYNLRVLTWLGDADLDPRVVLELTMIGQTIASSHESEANANEALLLDS
jgi:hypothetical protein